MTSNCAFLHGNEANEAQQDGNSVFPGIISCFPIFLSLLSL